MPDPVAKKPMTEEVAELTQPNVDPASTEQGADRNVANPGAPLEPKLPRGTMPRVFQPPQGYNRSPVVRAQPGKQLTPFDQLERLAAQDYIRCAIEAAKQQIVGFGWDVRVRDRFKKEADALNSQVEEVRDALENIDYRSQLTFEDILSLCLEDIYVYDALPIVPRASVGGRPIGIEVINPKTVKCYLDVLGRTPIPPYAAYAQIIYGYPETEFTTNDMWYLRTSILPDTPYGRSKTEMVMLTVNLALRNQLYDLHYYLNGSIPHSIYALDGEWTPKNLQEIQDYFDDIMKGNDVERSGIMRFLPAGDYKPTKERDWQYDFQEWLARVICWIFGVSPLPLVKVMSRSSGESGMQIAMEQGVWPVARFLEKLFTRYIQRVLKQQKLEFHFVDSSTEDEDASAQRDEMRLRSGQRTLNELRKKDGQDPYPPEIGDRPFLISGSGPIYLDDAVAQAKQNALIGNGLEPGANGLPKIPGAPVEASTLPAVPEAPKLLPKVPEAPRPPLPKVPAAPGSEPEEEKPEEDDSEEAKIEFAAWRRFALNAVKGKRRMRKFVSSAIEPERHEVLDALLARARAPKHVNHLFKAAMVGNGPGSRSWRRSEKAFAAAVNGWLSGIKVHCMAWAKNQLPKQDAATKLMKIADGPNTDASQHTVDALIRAAELAHQGGQQDAYTVLGLTFDQPSAKAMEYARARAAELVGKKLVDGELVDNPNSQWAITDTLRDEIRDAVSNAIENGNSWDELSDQLENYFEGSRADMIGRTETGFAYNSGAAESYKDLEVENVEVLDGDGCMPNGHDDGAPRPSGTGLDENSQADGQVWTIEDFQNYPLGHPNCVRAAVPSAKEIEE